MESMLRIYRKISSTAVQMDIYRDNRLLIAFGSFVIALLALPDRDKDHKRKNNARPVAIRTGASYSEAIPA